jgi:hypothetical protein
VQEIHPALRHPLFGVFCRFIFGAWLSNGITNLMILRANRPVIPLRIGFGGRRPPLQAAHGIACSGVSMSAVAHEIARNSIRLRIASAVADRRYRRPMESPEAASL